MRILLGLRLAPKGNQAGLKLAEEVPYRGLRSSAAARPGHLPAGLRDAASPEPGGAGRIITVPAAALSATIRTAALPARNGPPISKGLTAQRAYKRRVHDDGSARKPFLVHVSIVQVRSGQRYQRPPIRPERRIRRAMSD
jgi:hypothetical protein